MGLRSQKSVNIFVILNEARRAKRAQIIPSCRHKHNYSIMMATPVGAVCAEPPLQYELLLV